MEDFLNETNSIFSIESLIHKKEQIKNHVMDKEVAWELRIILYRQVQLINERITHLDNNYTQKSDI